MVHEIAVARHHAAGTVGLLQHLYAVGSVKKTLIAPLLLARPARRLAAEGHRRLQRHVAVHLAQHQHALRKVEVAALCHAAEKVPVAPSVELHQRLHDIHFQIQTPEIVLPVAPGQLGGSMSGEAAAHGEKVHGSLRMAQ